MDDQMQCPNCGGFRVETKAQSVYCETDKYIPINPFMRIFVAFGAVFGIFIVLPLLLLSKKGREQYYDQLIKGRRKEIKQETTIYHCTCNLCNYKWDWNIREPKPEAHIRPDLIAKGAQRNEEASAAYAYYQQTQRNKK